MYYEGESLLPGQLGNFFIILSLVSSLLASISYFLASQNKIESEKKKWIRLGRLAFLTDVLSVMFVFGILLFIIGNHLFEYKYVWQHSSLSLESKYLLACLWEGQEGSFLLWSLWHCILGLILIKQSKKWEAPVMTVISIAQFCLATMIAGIYLFGIKMGSNPFVLLRNEIEAPIFSQPNYLSYIKDGNDLNPLLQNYWMVIHPPVLFLGFASFIIPFSYAIAGLWTGKFKEWVKPAIPWALFSAAALGTGLILGSLWAYESLTFGGYWAWDPVENASLVPWLILVSGIHVLIIFQKTGRSLRTGFFLIIVSFLLILYSTFLTRSGILGDTSVHAFTDLGMNFQLLLFLLLFVIPSILLFIWQYRKIPIPVKEEHFSSREFWMFIGSLVMLISAASIIMMTSIPVFNKIAGFFSNDNKSLFKPLATGENSEYSYNRIQIVIAITIGFLSGAAQFLKYKKTESRYFYHKILLPTFFSIIISIPILVFGNFEYNKYGTGYKISIWIAIFSAIFSIITNLSYIKTGFKGKLNFAGASISHTGFGIMLLGILISATKKETLSFNTTDLITSFNEQADEIPGENLTLIKDVPADMKNYRVTYKDQTSHISKPLWYYHIHFEKKDKSREFTLTPNAFVNYKGQQGLMSNPDAKHSWNKDIFAYITSIPDPAANTDTIGFTEKTIVPGDSVPYRGGYLILDTLIIKKGIQQLLPDTNNTASIASFNIVTNNQKQYHAEPILIKKDNKSYLLADTVNEEGLIIQLVDIENQKAKIGYKLSEKPPDYVTLKVYSFPFIILYWLGAFITIVGFTIAVTNHLKASKLKSHKV